MRIRMMHGSTAAGLLLAAFAVTTGGSAARASSWVQYNTPPRTGAYVISAGACGAGWQSRLGSWTYLSPAGD